ncbi:MAG: hypothetical protein PWQ94_2031, partial [Thermoanaerobacterium sp.]|nr:hypothetical protein [Thermoanaerobacterium sp.]
KLCILLINQSFVIQLLYRLQRILYFCHYPFSLTPFPCKRNNFIYFFLFQFSHLILSNHLFYGTSLFASILSHPSTMRVCGVGEGMSLFYIHTSTLEPSHVLFHRYAFCKVTRFINIASFFNCHVVG